MPRKESPLPGVELLSDGRVRVLVYLGRDALGKRRHVRRTFPTVKAANEFKRDTLRARDAGTLAEGGAVTVEAHCTRWLALPAERRGGATRFSYESALRVHVYPGLGTARLDRLTPLRLQDFFDGLLDAGRGRAAVLMAYKALSGALKQAVAWGMIPANPCRGVVLPAPDPAPAAALTLAEARRLLAAAAEDRTHGPLVAALLHTGLRVGEAVALGWEDIDLEAGLLRVRRRVTRGADGARVIAPGAKSRRGLRAVKLGAEAVGWFRRQRAIQNAWRLACGDAWADLDLVFTRPDGTPLSTDAARRGLARLCRAAGLAPVGPHALRSTHATLVAEVATETEMLALQRRLGHASSSQTAYYVRPGAEIQESLADRIDERLRGEGGGG